MMIREGITTPAIHGAKYTSISCKPRKYQGALEGFMVRVGLAGSSSGAFRVMDHTIRMMVRMIAARNSMRSRKGHTWTSRVHSGRHGWVLRWWVLAISGLADRKSTRLNSSHLVISYAVFCLKKK